MRLALLGLDETTVALARAAHDNGRDELILFCDFESTEQLKAILRSVAIQPQSWEMLLASGPGGIATFDAALVARDPADDDRRLEQLRKLVQAGVPMLLSHPVHSSMLAYYELDMIRRESGCVMVPFLPLRRNPLVTRLKNLIEHEDQSELGQVDQIIFERSLPDAAREVVAAEFARDTDLLQFLGGEIAQLGAMGLPGARSKPATVYSNLGVQMTTSSGRLLRWSVDPTDDSWDCRVVVSGHSGKATLTLPGMSSSKAARSYELQLETKTIATLPAPVVVEWNPYESSLDELREALSERKPFSRWPNAARAIELAETVERSLAKGRTIDLHDQEFSDTATFKGLMTSVGCLLLLFALGATVAAALVANLLKHAGALGAAQVVGSLPYVFLGLFCLFLAVQFLLKLVKPPGHNQIGGGAAPPQGPDDKV